MDFHIPAQPLESALHAYGEATRIQIFVDARLVAGVQSAELSGTLTPEVALHTTAQKKVHEQPSVIIVEVLGYGGGDGRKQERRSEYNPAAPIKVMGDGPLGAEDMQGLTEDERRKLTAAR